MANNWLTLFFDESGPKISYWTDETLHIDDLNPEIHIVWKVTKAELFKIGLMCIWAVLPKWLP